MKNRISFMRAKCDPSSGASRSLTAGNISTVIERDFDDSLDDIYLQLGLNNILEIIFLRGVQTRILWDVVRQNITSSMNNSFPIPRPPIKDGPQKERKILNCMTEISNSCITFQDTCKSNQEEIEKYLVGTNKHVFELEKFRLYKEKLREEKHKEENEGLMVIKERQRKKIRSINMMRGIITKLIAGTNINYLEHPEVVEIIKNCRNVVTEDNVKEKAQLIYSRFNRTIQFSVTQ
ncbi:uncharacterized protein LOC142320536 isoform X2 [Lycorma delicatula]